MSAAATAAAPPPPGAPPSSPTTVVAVAVDGGDEVAAVGQPPAPAPVDGDPTSPPPKRGSFSRPTAAEHPFVDGRVEPGEPVGSAPPPVPLLAPPTATVLHLTATVCLALAAAGLAAFGVGTAVTARAWQQGGHGPAHGGPAVAALLLVAAALLGVTAGLGAAATAAARRPRGVHLGRSFVYAGGASGAVLAAAAAGTAVTASAVGRHGGAAGWAFGLVATLATAVGGVVLVDVWRVLQGVRAGGGWHLQDGVWERRSSFDSEAEGGHPSSVDSEGSGEGARWGRGGGYGAAGESGEEGGGRRKSSRQAWAATT